MSKIHISKELEGRSYFFEKQKKAPYQKNWWGYIWRGLLVERNGKHYKSMGRAIWLYLYLVVHADRQTGELKRKTQTISDDMGISKRTIQRWLQTLRNTNYITTTTNGRALKIKIMKWRRIYKRH